MFLSKKIIEKPWGYEEIWAHTENYVGKMIVINPGHRLSFQYHNEKEETVRVVSGNLTVWYEENGHIKQIVLFEGESFHVPVKSKHRFGCDKKEFTPVVICEVSTPQINDVVRIEDDYKRD